MLWDYTDTLSDKMRTAYAAGDRKAGDAACDELLRREAERLRRLRPPRCWLCGRQTKEK